MGLLLSHNVRILRMMTIARYGRPPWSSSFRPKVAHQIKISSRATPKKRQLRVVADPSAAAQNRKCERRERTVKSWPPSSKINVGRRRRPPGGQRLTATASQVASPSRRPASSMRETSGRHLFKRAPFHHADAIPTPPITLPETAGLPPRAPIRHSRTSAPRKPPCTPAQKRLLLRTRCFGRALSPSP